MAFDKKPSTWLGAGYELDAGNHVLKLNTADAASDKTLAQLTDAEGHATTGDIRKVIFALLEALYQAHAAVDAADRPSRVTLYKSSQATGGVLTHTYTVVCVNDITAEAVADEPA